MYSLLIVVLVAYLCVAGAIAMFQRKLMYHPSKEIGAPEQYGLSGVDDILITAKDGTKLQLWLHAPREGYPTIVYFHGNAGHIGDRSIKFGAFIEAGFGLVAGGYRGFGKSDGMPAEQGIYNDARAVVDYALGTLNLPPGRVIYFGESLGSGVAVQMASERAPALLVLEAAYTSVATRSAEMFPYVLFARHLVRDRYDSLSKIGKVRCPLLMLHGDKDITIPLRHGHNLFNAASEPKSMIVYPGVGHTDYTTEQIVSPILATARQLKLL